MTTVAPSAATDLCTNCGLCCDGTVFDNIAAYPQDIADFAKYGLQPDSQSERPKYLLPCPQLDHAKCKIYPDRFVTCRSFRCPLLQQLDAGEISLEAGLATIATARALVAAVEPEARLARPRRVFATATAGWLAMTDPAAKIAAARQHLAIFALERFLDRHFRKAGGRARRTEDQRVGPNPKSTGPNACGNSSDKA